MGMSDLGERQAESFPNKGTEEKLSLSSHTTVHESRDGTQPLGASTEVFPSRGLSDHVADPTGRSQSSAISSVHSLWPSPSSSFIALPESVLACLNGCLSLTADLCAAHPWAHIVI